MCIAVTSIRNAGRVALNTLSVHVPVNGRERRCLPIFLESVSSVPRANTYFESLSGESLKLERKEKNEVNEGNFDWRKYFERERGREREGGKRHGTKSIFVYKS